MSPRVLPRLSAALFTSMLLACSASEFDSGEGGKAESEKNDAGGSTSTPPSSPTAPTTAPTGTSPGGSNPTAPGTTPDGGVSGTTVAHFTTLPVGSVLPTDAECASRLRKSKEVRADNAGPNGTVGTSPNGRFPRVTGNFTGTTDEILQWVACKWGIDEDIVRAQAAKESYWHESARGDMTTNQSACYPTLRTTNGSPCPESVGILQVRFLYHSEAFKDGNALASTAYNADYAYAVWRSCFEGKETWLNDYEKGGTYAAGDAMGCLGVWFSGRWRTAPAETYIQAVSDYMSQKIWTTQSFEGG